jgi:hypothetical protein
VSSDVGGSLDGDVYVTFRAAKTWLDELWEEESRQETEHSRRQNMLCERTAAGEISAESGNSGGLGARSRHETAMRVAGRWGDSADPCHGASNILGSGDSVDGAVGDVNVESCAYLVTLLQSCVAVGDSVRSPLTSHLTSRFTTVTH